MSNNRIRFSTASVLADVNGVTTLVKSAAASECYEYCLRHNWVTEAGVSLRIIDACSAPHC